MIKKRSVTIKGHATSVSLEDAFWSELKRMAAAAGQPLSGLINQIDGARGTDNLSSALRLAVFNDLKAQLTATKRPVSES